MTELTSFVAASAAYTDRVQSPVIATTAVPQCVLCGGNQHSPFSSGFDYESETCANTWTFVRCDACAHVWLTPRPAVETLGIIYPPTYYAYNYDQQISSIAVKAKARLDQMKMRWILKGLSHAPRRFVDIGCGDGRFLRVMENAGLKRQDLYGLELDAKVIKPLQDAGYQAFQERVESCEGIPAGDRPRDNVPRHRTRGCARCGGAEGRGMARARRLFRHRNAQSRQRRRPMV